MISCRSAKLENDCSACTDFVDTPVGSLIDRSCAVPGRISGNEPNFNDEVALDKGYRYAQRHRHLFALTSHFTSPSRVLRVVVNNVTLKSA